MGLEFETGIKVRNGVKDLPYDEVIRDLNWSKDKSWQIKADSSSMEFVTEPLTTADELKSTLYDLTDYAHSLRVLFVKRRDDITLGDIESRYGMDPRGMWRVSKGELAAKPQVTFGVPLERLLTVMKQAEDKKVYGRSVPSQDGLATVPGDVPLSTKQEDTVNQFRNPHEIAMQFYNEHKAEFVGREEDLQKGAGVLTLIFRYMNDLWSPKVGSADYAKADLTVLSRTDFRTMYKELKSGVQNLITVEEIGRLYGVDVKRLAKQMTHPTGFAEGDGVNQGYRIDHWLESIILGGLPPSMSREQKRDIQSKDEENAKLYERMGKTPPAFGSKDLLSRGPTAYNSQSMGPMGFDTSDESLPGKRLTLVEFRELAKARALPLDGWTEFAEDMFTFYKNSLTVDAFS
jgi:hypothetical protein